ncbi:uncharacterized protein LOC110226900 [Arabidopsis lyrata subsp. lyrata]|uniref:uncharacterized protein LOC110226900 n=1 Tax=Arabidopsis lyrata subsp. lyrata TaxID=81972 RepID=UPI000A29E2AB|nr:uncharacterized protein LOC110226900 [Arabidopsis lyrata subsp. lyrata]|eukprot:XP_020875471.1 uncharacterized protein LOC110226900 [Arabidopsis lyrata subsp. lyrata]
MLQGLIRAVEIELPQIEHRMCVRHIYGNLKANHGKKSQIKPFIWNLAWSYNEAEYRENLERLKQYDMGVYEDVMKSNPMRWCRAFYKIGHYVEDVENNSTESFNNTIVKAREKPLVPMLEMIARLAMVRIAKRSVKSHDHKGLCTPYVEEYLAKELEDAAEVKVHRSTNKMFLAMLYGCSYRVSLNQRTCSCRKWDITGIPCVHAYGVILKLKLKVEDYVCHWFRTTQWKKNYTEGLVPLRGARFWPVGTTPQVHPAPEPPQPGRKKKSKKVKRKKGKNESPLKKQPKLLKRVMHCGVCGEANHNSRFHKKKKEVPQGEPSQGTVTQEMRLN